MIQKAVLLSDIYITRSLLLQHIKPLYISVSKFTPSFTGSVNQSPVQQSFLAGQQIFKCFL